MKVLMVFLLIVVACCLILFLSLSTWDSKESLSMPVQSDRGIEPLSGQDELVGRLAAAQAITDNDRRWNALAAVAKEAAAAGKGEMVMPALEGIGLVSLREKLAAECALKLNERGQRWVAVEVAKSIMVISDRDRVLDQLAKDRK